MHKTPTILAAGFMMAMAPASQAGVEWLAIGPWFAVGDRGFVLVYGQPGLSYPRAYYYRTALPPTDNGRRCSAACLEDGDVTHHHEGCPLVREHFLRHGVDPTQVLSFFAPRAYQEGRTFRFEDVANERTVSSPSGAGAGLMPSARPGPLF
jgi:hypothetical protein